MQPIAVVAVFSFGNCFIFFTFFIIIEKLLIPQLLIAKNIHFQFGYFYSQWLVNSLWLL